MGDASASGSAPRADREPSRRAVVTAAAWAAPVVAVAVGAPAAAASTGTITAVATAWSRGEPDGTGSVVYSFSGPPITAADVSVIGYSIDGATTVAIVDEGGGLVRVSFIVPNGAETSIDVTVGAPGYADGVGTVAIANGGTIDTAFSAQLGGGFTGGDVATVVQQASGRILVGGGFTALAGAPVLGLAGLQPDGAVDSAFVGTVTGGQVAEIALTPAGVVLVGSFTHVGGQPRSGIALLSADGALDPAFDPGAGFDAPASAVVVQSSGGLVVGGSFTAYDGTPVPPLVRILSTGALDPAFVAPTFVDEVSAAAAVVALARFANDDLVIVGRFTELDGIERRRAARLGADGSLDLDFDARVGALNTASWVSAVAIDAAGNVVVGGWFNRANGVIIAQSIARFDGTTGAVEPEFAAQGFNGDVRSIVGLPDGRILVGGSFSAFTRLDSTVLSADRFVRLTADGDLDTTFATAFPVVTGTWVQAATVQQDGAYLAGGNFVIAPTRGLVRVRA